MIETQNSKLKTQNQKLNEIQNPKNMIETQNSKLKTQNQKSKLKTKN